MNVTVASGKGGTGKTLVALNMACSQGEEIHVVDCDVEEPNLHLFLHPQITHQEKVFLPVPEVNKERCTGCRKCAEVCAFNAIAVFLEEVVIFPELCHGCRSCILFCPQKALQEGKRELGMIEQGRQGNISFYQGSLNTGEALAPPIIRYLKKRWTRKGSTILDAPPGTSCPVVETVKGSDYVLLVTEPTPFGLHDLDLSVQLCQKMGLKVGLVINRSDIGDNGVNQFAKREGLPVLLTIPYQEEIARSYAQGRILVKEDAVWKRRFQDLWQGIIQEVSP